MCFFVFFLVTWCFYFRGTESSGLVGTDGIEVNHFEFVKGHGLVRDVYTSESLARFKGMPNIVYQSFIKHE